MLDSTEPITLPNACHMGWTVQVLCTGTALLSERKLCVMGCCLEGHWFRPPAYFTDKMVVLVLLPESIINVPCKESMRKSWYEKWNTEFVDVYKVLVTELFSRGVSSNSTVFLGVSDGILITMTLLTSLMKDETVHMRTPMTVFIAGPWHPQAHPQFREAILSLDPWARPRVFVVNHSKDSVCSWSEQESFWHQLEKDYENLILQLLEYQGSAAAEMFDSNYHDLGCRLAASTEFWDWLLGKDVSISKLRKVASVACDWNEITRIAPFPGYAHSLGLRLLCKLWKDMWIPNLENPDWAAKLTKWMEDWCGEGCSQMLREKCRFNWPVCLDSPKLGEYYLAQLCGSFANSYRKGILRSELYPTHVSLKHLHHTTDMELLDVEFIREDESKCLKTYWRQNGERTLNNASVSFTQPCIIILRFTSGPCLVGFYHSHLEHNSRKRGTDGTEICSLQRLRSLAIACTPETLQACSTPVRCCVGIEVVQLTSLMGIGSLGRLIFPPDKRFRAWIAETGAATQLPASRACDASEFHAVMETLPLPSGVRHMLDKLLPLVESNLMTAVVCPPGTSKNTNIAGLLRLLLQHHRVARSCKPLQILLCTPTNHTVQELEIMVRQLTSEYEFTFIRICSAMMLTSSDKGKRRRTATGKAEVLHNFEYSLVDRLAQEVHVNSLDEVFCGKVTVMMSTLEVLQQTPSVTYDPFKCLATSFDWILIDEADQTVDTRAYILHHLLSRDGRYVLFGDQKGISCFSPLPISLRSAMEAALHWNCKVCLTEMVHSKQPNQHSDSGDSPPVKQETDRHNTPVPPPYPPAIAHGPANFNWADWALTVVKHVNRLPAKFNFHHDPWPGYPEGRERIIIALSEVFEWTPTQLKWFLDSVNILWELFYSTKPTGDKNVYYNYICRKAKIIGIVPFRLLQGVRLEDNLAKSGATIYTKDVLPENVTRVQGVRLEDNLAKSGAAIYTKEVLPENVTRDMNECKKKLVVEVHSTGSADNCLMALWTNDKFRILRTRAPDASRRERVKRWTTGPQNRNEFVSDMLLDEG